VLSLSLVKAVVDQVVKVVKVNTKIKRAIIAAIFLPSASFADISTDVQSLQLQTAKLNNQVQYLINQQSQSGSQAFTQQLSDLRGKVELNAYKINQLNDVVVNKLAQFEKQIAALQEEVNKPSPQALKLQQDNAAFDKANSALLAKNYSEAETMLKQYLKAYYNGEHYSESLYLLGQVYLIDGKIDLAYEQFKTIFTRYPRSIKIADATYALALLELSKGDVKAAKNHLLQVVDKYPQHEVAVKAKAELKKINVTTK